MDNKKIVSVAVLAVLALAFAGYGYADYTASTYNADNSVVVNYITVEPESWAAIAATQEVKIDTYTYNDNGDADTLFVLDNMPEEAGCVQIGNNYNLTITNGAEIEFTKYTIDVSVLGTVNQGTDDGFEFRLYLNYGEDDATYQVLSNSTMSFEVDADATGATFGIYLYVDDIKTIQFPDASGWNDVTGTTAVPPVGPVLSGPVDEDDPDVNGDDPNTTDADAVETGAVFIFKVTGVTA